MVTELLLIDADAEFTSAASASMRLEGFEVRVANSMQQARDELTGRMPQVLASW